MGYYHVKAEVYFRILTPTWANTFQVSVPHLNYKLKSSCSVTPPINFKVEEVSLLTL